MRQVKILKEFITENLFQILKRKVNNMADKDYIYKDIDDWDDGVLGADEEFAEAVPVDLEVENKALGLKAISIRLQKSLIEDFKFIAEVNGIGYQTLIRQMLTRFATSEKRRILNEVRAREIKQAKFIENARAAKEASLKEFSDDVDDKPKKAIA